MSQDADQPLSGAKSEDVSQWILDMVGAISKETVKNAWRKKGYSYFEEQLCSVSLFVLHTTSDTVTTTTGSVYCSF